MSKARTKVAAEDLAFTPMAEIGRMLRAGEITSAELTRTMLDRIDRLNPQLNCFITVVHEQAVRQAEGLDRLLAAGVDLGPLHGIPVAIKDNLATAGVRTTIGSRIFANWVPEKDAAVVRRVKEAGGVILGKLTMYEFAFGGWHDDYGPETRNPWDLTRACGASSNGPSSAVAAGLAYASLGTDTGGSVRLPAAACGLVGLKPTYGVVSRAGLAPGGYSLDHIGPLARNVRDATIMFAAIAGPDRGDPAGSWERSPDYLGDLDRGIDGLTVGVPETQASELIDPEMGQACEAAIKVLAKAGARVKKVKVPDHLLSRTLMWTIAASELAEAHRDHLRDRAGDYSPTVHGLIKQGAFIPATEYVRAQRVRQKILSDYEEVMRDVDLIAMPTVPFAAWNIGDEDIVVDGKTENLMACLTRYCPPFNITGQPAVALATGFDKAGLPLSFQIGGRWHEDALVMRAAAAYEARTDWHTRRPPIR
jgi:aspartyl-tRNA(Asn)/glutamyl-tRNA(Gln) amidotransferase subunit A